MPEPLPRSSSTAVCEEGTKGLSLSKEGSVYVSACISVLISVTLLPALVLCQQEVRASSTLPSDRHTHTYRVPRSLTTQEPLQTWPGSRSPQPEVTLTSSTWGPSPSRIRWAASAFFCREERGEEKQSYLCHLLQVAALCSSSPLC